MLLRIELFVKSLCCRLSNGSIPGPPSPQQAQPAGSDSFDPFGTQTATDGVPSPSAEATSANGTPSETLSRHSALSAFAESLKQPALVGDSDDLGSPLSAATPSDAREGKEHKKTSKRSHRRSSSEPVPLENVNLVEERADS